MASAINTNISSLTAQRNLGASQVGLQATIARLSSGMRINSAKDDAAGLAISERFTSQIRGLNQAARNANDGVSLAQVAEGAAKASADVLQRIRELAVQSANASNSATDRKALQAEVSQLVAELDRAAFTAEFNGTRLLDGSFGTQQFQAGPHANQTIAASLANLRTATYGNHQVQASDGVTANWNAYRQAGGAVADAAWGSNGTAAASLPVANRDGTVVATVDVPANASAADIAARFNAAASATGVAAQAQTRVRLDFSAPGSYQLQISSDGTATPAITFTLDGTTGDALGSAIAAINARAASTGVTAAAAPDGAGILLTQAEGRDVRIAETGLSFSQTGDVTVRKAGHNGDAIGAAVVLDANTIPVTAATTESALIGGEVWLHGQDGFGIAGAPAANVQWGDNGILNGNLVIQGTPGNATVAVTVQDTAQTVAARINTRQDATGVSAAARTEVQLAFGAPGHYVLVLRAGDAAARTVSFEVPPGDGADRFSGVLTALNAAGVQAGVFASLNADGTAVVLVHPEGADVMVSDTAFANAGDVTVAKRAADGQGLAPAGTLRADTVAENAVVAGSITLDSDHGFSIDTLDSNIFTDTASTLHPVSRLDISTAEGATDALKTVDAALAYVNGARARLGALQSRFETAIASLAIGSENTSAARSRIQDADFAIETANLARLQILQQAGTAMVAQANQLPQGVLALLRQ